jgi:hypothetical protein
VLLIMGDYIGYGHMSAFGGPANTPTFDRLAKQGLTFTNFHTTAVAQHRAPLCSSVATHMPSAWERSQRLLSGSRAITQSFRVAPQACSRFYGRTVTALPGSEKPT